MPDVETQIIALDWGSNPDFLRLLDKCREVRGTYPIGVVPNVLAVVRAACDELTRQENGG